MTDPDLRFVAPYDDEWPAALSGPCGRDVAPLGLWVRGRGELHMLLRRSVVVLGAAAATPYAVKVAHRLAADLGGAGWTVVTSGATGVASAVRYGAHSAGGPALVLPLGGLACPRPRAHATQYDRASRTGLVISESYGPLEPAADRLARNRVLSALGTAVVVIEPAGIAVDVARRARDRGRPVFAVPGGVTDDSPSRSAHRLIRDGLARLARDARDVLSDLGDA